MQAALASRGHKLFLAYRLIQDYCEQAINHLIDIQNCVGRDCLLEAREAISSLLYVMPRCEELLELRLLEPLISSKFGYAFVTEVAENSVLCAVDKKIMMLLSSSVPNWPTRKAMLEKIAIDFNINPRVPSNQASLKKLTKADEPKRSSHGLLSSTSSLAHQSIPSQGQSSTCKELQLTADRSSIESSSSTPSLSEASFNKNGSKQGKEGSLGSAKNSSKKMVRASSGSKKHHIEPLYQPSTRRFNKVMSLHSSVPN
ncbi:hypothetical protein L7F22_023260 [Adiantum nelumboides]|nr:hypothetical protein [Adiantum nelumboides]